MPAVTDRLTVTKALAEFQTRPLKEAARRLLDALGYRSDRSLAGRDSSPRSFIELFPASGFDQEKARVSEWKTADLLFQLTDQELSRASSLFTDTAVKAGLLKSYVFIAIELKGSDYARGKFSTIARQINRIFPMPVMVFFRHQGQLTIAVINRRMHKLDESKDVLGKVTLIREIDCAQPHRGHLDILASLALENLVHPQKKPITDFDTLHAAWEQIFNIELLNERFYRELANWYFWALPQVEFPADLEPDSEKRRATGLIRLLTRLIFCWFLKEKGLIPEKLFHQTDLQGLLRDLDDEGSSYYQAILQNLFFATLNQRMGRDPKGQPYRFFAKDEGWIKNKATYDVNNLYRYESLFRAPDTALTLFEDIPFLNGGLFECLDRTEDGTGKKRYLDGFSRNARKRPTIPNLLFFGGEQESDLSAAYGDTKRKKEKVSGLIRILNRYKFTIVENTPIDQEIALDPELLGKVFENLLASYNEETKTTARKQTGSFYTPRPIVDYMVDESLKAHLERKLTAESAEDAEAGKNNPTSGSPSALSAPSAVKKKLDDLFAYTEKEHPFTASEVATLIAAIDALKILDPACGSGAFPMGVLHKLVYILGKLDPGNDRWKATQLAKLDSAPMREELERAFADNNDDYGRKLYLIENCLYGVDIQPIAIQITKLRFFISLVCDQKTNRNKKDNHGIRPLPNLETKFVAANSLIGLPEMTQTLLVDPRVSLVEKEIESLYHSHFSIQRRDQKLALQRKIKTLRQDLAKLLAESLMSPAKAKHVAEWDPFDPQSSADFFDPHWMFGRSLADGFDVVIANPPYVRQEAIKDFKPLLKAQGYECFEGVADLFVYFYEKSVRLLRPGGVLSFITPNKYYRAGYGQKLRGLLARELTLLRLIDFGDAPVFEAIAYASILVGVRTKPTPDASTRACTWEKEMTFDGIAEVVAERGQQICQSELKPDGWRLTSPAVFRLLEKLHRAGKPLGEYVGGRFYRGIGTGLNEAFVVDRATRDRLLNEQKSAVEVLKPFLRGRDVKRWRVEDQDRWLIYIPWHFPLHGDAGITSASKKAEDEFRKQYSSIYAYLEQYKEQLSARDKAETCIRYEWYAVARPRYEIETEFARPKIIYPDIYEHQSFAWEGEGFYPANTCYFISTSEKWLTGLLNSLAVEWFYGLISNQVRGGYMRAFSDYMRQIPIPATTPAQQKPLEHLVERILAAKQANPAADTSALEREIDQQVCALYGLTPEEIAIVEGTAQ